VVGTLYLVATPIGNLEDISQRALRVLREVDLIAAEDTRQTRKLLTRYEIDTPLISYHEHNKLKRKKRLLSALEEGDLALVSDAGTPGLSDPGFLLISAALEAGHPISPIPGPSAPIAALVASGLPSDSFLFLGYLPRKRVERTKLLESLARERRTLIAFEAPHRLRAALEDLGEILGKERPVAVCRELTKLHEEIVRGTISYAYEHFTRHDPRGEFTLVIGGSSSAERWDEEAVRLELNVRLAEGLSPSEAAREVAAVSGWPRREVYRLTMEER
jgi:16S rRNA (cytidine1402-2'-O)-methyltransferase